MSVVISENSRLNDAEWVVASNGTENIEFWDLPMAAQIKPADDDLLYRVDKTDRKDNIAWNQYRDPRLWDVIADINGMSLLPVDLKPGDLIRLPSYNRVVVSIRG